MIAMAAALGLLLSLALLGTTRIDTAMWICALQALFAAAPFGERAGFALLAFALNGIALPLAIARTERTDMLTAVHGNAWVWWVAAAVILLATGIVFADVGAGGLVAAGVSVVLLGLLMAVLRSQAAVPIGLLSSQNGLVLVAAAQPGLSLSAACAVAVPLVPALVLAERRLRR